MLFAIMDMETDGLRDEVTLMHCFCVSVYKNNKLLEKLVITSSSELSKFFSKLESKGGILIGHKIVQYDLPVIEDLFGITFNGTVWDTLAMSYKLYPDQKIHGLEYYGEILGVPKPKIEDWKNQELKSYIHRCERDVSITILLFSKLFSYFKKIYHPLSPKKDIQYCTWKLGCAREQEENPIKINVEGVKTALKKVSAEYEERVETLKDVMPKDIKYKTVKPPKKLLKKDGNLSARGEKWLDILSSQGLPKNHDEPVKVVKEILPPNPGSPDQLKNWLFSLGWQPTIYKTRISKVTKIAKEVPQIQDDDKNLCENITEVLMEDNPELEVLSGMFMLKHRVGVFKSILEKLREDETVIAEVGGFTNTMRFKHKKPLANLPKISKPYGKEIRGAFMARNEDYLFCGSDMSSLEDSTKQHYMYFYDPEYVMEMRVPGFDPHVDIAVFAGLMTDEEEKTFKRLKKKKGLFEDGESNEDLTQEEAEIFNYLSDVRSNAKTVNFAGVYGAGPPKLSKVLKCTLDFSQKLHSAYWLRNKAVKQVEKDSKVKIVDEQLWLWNPVSKMWYYLKKMKDIFSTLNQGTGVYCFDVWVKQVRKKGIKIMLQYHDEIGFDFKKEDREFVRESLHKSIDEANEILKLNVPLSVSVDIGNDYSESH